MSNQQCEWPGATGNIYLFNIYQMKGDWNPVPGVYIFAKCTSPGRWTALYVGETHSFKERLTPSHEEWSKAVRLGATHVHARVVRDGPSARKTVETDLIRKLDPPLNQKPGLRRAG